MEKDLNAQSTARNGFIDFWKFIAALGVILVHAPLAGIPGNIATAVGVCGVGFFYLISGYACYGPDKNEMCRKITKRLIRNAIITIITVSLYFLFAYFEKKAIGEYILLKLALRRSSTWWRMLLIGDFEFIYGAALWFMIALLQGYLIFLLIVRFNLKILVYILTPVFLIIRIVVDSYVNSFGADWHLSGNLIVGALPMMLLGYLMADKKERLIALPNVAIIITIILSTLAMFAAVNFKIGKIDISQPFKILCGASLFLYGIKNPGAHIFRPLEKLGREDSLFIYLIHFPIIVVLYDLNYYNPLLVILISVVLARILGFTVKKIKDSRYRKSLN